jgi:tetratricopeptide (TPR) repeat protein
MQIEKLTVNPVINESIPITINAPIEKLTPPLESTSIQAGWRRMKAEMPLPIDLETQEQLLARFKETINARQYGDALKLIDRLQEPDILPIASVIRLGGVTKLALKAFCLEMLGRSDEALVLIIQALEERKLVGEMIKEEFRTSSRVDLGELFDKLSPEIIEEMIQEALSKFDRDLARFDSYFLLQQGFIYLSLNEKDLAIDVFKRAAEHADCDKDFLFRILEKKLGVQLVPSIDYENEIERILSENNFLCDNCYLLGNYYALLGNYEEALHWYNKMDFYVSYPPVFALLAYLKGDLESAQEELINWPLRDKDLDNDDRIKDSLHYSLLVNNKFLQQ